LEALVNSLRSHLTRLSFELSSHQKLLVELRNLREQDARALQEKSTEILQLREEVQRLAGEVEVLRGVVEEGLKERRASKESIHIDLEKEEGNIETSQNFQEEGEEGGPLEERQAEHEEGEVTQDDDEEDEEDNTEIFASGVHVADKTMRTDRATLGESTNSKSADVAYVDGDFDKIEAEVEERRSNRSIESRMSRSPSPARRTHDTTKGAKTPDASEDDERPVPQLQPSTSRLAVPSPGHTGIYARSDIHKVDSEPETPFPKIRGEHLERLFFSAPEHNAKTCTVCHRRRHRPHESSFWSKLAAPAATCAQPDIEQGNDGGYESPDEQRPSAETTRKGKGREYARFAQDPTSWRRVATNQGLAPQTVVARVIRELEDDFTHYKRWVYKQISHAPYSCCLTSTRSSVYVELADQYKVMDATSDVRRRNLLAQHLREVVDILEQKVCVLCQCYFPKH